MKEQVLYHPSPVQQEAHDCPADEILYGGTAGPGKTVWMRWDPFVTQLFGEHDRYLAAREAGEQFESEGWALFTMRNLGQMIQTQEFIERIGPKLDPGSRWWANDHMMEFTCGYKWQMGHLEHESSWRAYDSRDYTWLGLDEATQFYKTQFDGLRARVRSTDPVLMNKTRVCLASNPDSPVHGRWVYEEFVEPAMEGRTLLRNSFTRFDGSVGSRTRMYIPAYLADNPNPDFRRKYEDILRTLPRHLMLARLMCDWNVIEGAFFEYEWIPSVHVVDPFVMPAHWPRFRMMDWAYKQLCAVLYGAITDDGDMVIWKELTFNGPKCPPAKRKDSEQVAEAIKQFELSVGLWDKEEDCSKITGPADYQICEQRDGGYTIEEKMAARGVYWTKSHKDRRGGTAEIVRRLKDIPAPGSPAHPGIRVFRTCRELCSEMPKIPISSTDPEVPEDCPGYDAIDALMYGCMYRLEPGDQPDIRVREEWEQNDLTNALNKRQRVRRGYGA